MKRKGHSRKWYAAMRRRRIGAHPLSTAERNARWVRKTRSRLIEAYGGFCWGFGCGASGGQLELAHLYPTEVSGRSRGSRIRLRDVRLHPFAYMTLCPRCHRKIGGPETWGPFPKRDDPVEADVAPELACFNAPYEDDPPAGPHQAALHE
jgi:hypothetical protein